MGNFIININISIWAVNQTKQNKQKMDIKRNSNKTFIRVSKGYTDLVPLLCFGPTKPHVGRYCLSTTLWLKDLTHCFPCSDTNSWQNSLIISFSRNEGHTVLLTLFIGLFKRTSQLLSSLSSFPCSSIVILSGSDV